MLTREVLNVIFGKYNLPWYLYIPFLLISPILLIFSIAVDVVIGIVSLVIAIILLPFRLLWFILKQIYRLVRLVI